MTPTHPPPSRLLACMSACLTAALRSRRRCCASCTPRRLEKRCDLREPSPKPQPLSLPPLPRCPVAAAAGGGHVVEIQKYFLIRAQVSGKVIPGSNGRRKDFSVAVSAVKMKKRSAFGLHCMGLAAAAAVVSGRAKAVRVAALPRGKGRTLHQPHRQVVQHGCEIEPVDEELGAGLDQRDVPDRQAPLHQPERHVLDKGVVGVRRDAVDQPPVYLREARGTAGR